MRWLDLTPKQRDADLARARRLRLEHGHKFGEIERYCSSNLCVNQAFTESSVVRRQAELESLKYNSPWSPPQREEWLQTNLRLIKPILEAMVKECAQFPAWLVREFLHHEIEAAVNSRLGAC